MTSRRLSAACGPLWRLDPVVPYPSPSAWDNGHDGQPHRTLRVRRRRPRRFGRPCARRARRLAIERGANRDQARADRPSDDVELDHHPNTWRNVDIDGDFDLNIDLGRHVQLDIDNIDFHLDHDDTDAGGERIVRS